MRTVFLKMLLCWSVGWTSVGPAYAYDHPADSLYIENSEENRAISCALSPRGYVIGGLALVGGVIFITGHGLQYRCQPSYGECEPSRIGLPMMILGGGILSGVFSRIGDVMIEIFQQANANDPIDRV